MSNRKQAYLFVGDDDYPMGVAARELVDRLVPASEQAFGLEIIEGRADSEEDAVAAIKRCHEALVTPGFLMARGKVIWWRAVTFLSDVQLSSSDGVKSGMKDLAVALERGQAGETALIITASGIDKRSAFYKLAAAQFEIREFMLPEKAGQMEQFGRGTITRMLREKGVTANSDAVEVFLQRIGADSRLIASEVEKLCLYLGQTKQATVKDVLAVVSTTPTSAMWDIQDAVAERRLAGALEVLRDLLAAKVNARAILSSVSSRIKELLLYREALDQGWLRIKGSGNYQTVEWLGLPDDVESVLDVAFKRNPRTLHPYVMLKLSKQARGFSMSELIGCQRLITGCYEDMTSGRVPEQTSLELMLIRMLGLSRC